LDVQREVAELESGFASEPAAMFSAVGIARGTSYWALCVPLIGTGCGIALSMPPPTSALHGSMEKSRSGVEAGVLNSLRPLLLSGRRCFRGR
jgi:MFS transporter, DHA2 family, methylenomycin A resistance protein